MALQGQATAVEDEVGAFVDAHLYVRFNLGLMGGGNDRAIVGFGVGGDADLEVACCVDHPFDEGVGRFGADGHSDRQGHATFASRAIGGADDVLHHLVEVGVGHDNPVVLGTTHGLNTFPVGGARGIDVLSDVGRADEADGPDIRMGQQCVDGFLVAVDDLEDTFRQTGLDQQFADAHRDAGVFFRRFEDKGVAAGECHGRHP